MFQQCRIVHVYAIYILICTTKKSIKAHQHQEKENRLFFLSYIRMGHFWAVRIFRQTDRSDDVGGLK